VIVPSIPQAILVFALGAVFVHFIVAGGRTFTSTNFADEPGAVIGQLAFVFGGVAPAWFLGLRQVIAPLNGVVAALLLVASVALYEWARHTIWGRRFGLGWGTHVPEAVCDQGPYRWVRHPVYLGYWLAYASILVALPHLLTAGVFVAVTGLFVHAAWHDEREIAGSALAADYDAYRKRTGMFFPKLS
jgi:protein-S-isoprenylcysteine O-methyltransferase Ste14